MTSIKRFIASLAQPDPSRDWLVALAFASLIGFLLLLYAVFLFYSIQSGSAFSEPKAVAPEMPLTRASLEDTVNAYQARQTNYAAHNLPAPVLVDPAK